MVEFELIEELKSLQGDDSRVNLGIGDDCAIISQRTGYETLITTDLLLDGVHFCTEIDSIKSIARKSLAVNLSDIAAMAGRPTAAFVSVVFPRNWKPQQARQLFQELVHAANEFQIPIAGGDTNTWSHSLAINISIYGETEQGKAIRRKGAQLGDQICVSGPLGGSIFGRQFTFTPRIAEALWLSKNAKVTSMIDISDGLISDLGHILNESKVGAEIFTEKIPISEDVGQFVDETPPLDHALSDGEDFELLWTMPPAELEKILKNKSCPVQIFPVGLITAVPGCHLVDERGLKRSCSLKGFVHKLDNFDP
ncbi:thiamine-phosphate kinase [Rubinisphaera italica]|uniref:Thiamine-monophosphate kinase n=1 Tax=Rubinisphaera italica TaxID=2527969 RepID=A0A5C5XHV9_9PLAN|nr:thiamine-phosphate kinase [Rubinisphaera italica]TWT62394.1 Thiamine-monophosphate kinase [Rubinisphaera italica]